MKNQHLRTGLIALFLVAGCNALGDGSDGPVVDTGPSTGGAKATGGGGTGALPAYCDCQSEGQDASELAEELACFCQTYDCPALADVPDNYERTECLGGKIIYKSGGDYRHEERLLFREGKLVGYSKRFPVAPCGGEFVEAGDLACFRGNLCGDQGGAGGCRLVY